MGQDQILKEIRRWDEIEAVVGWFEVDFDSAAASVKSVDASRVEADAGRRQADKGVVAEE